MINSKDKGNRAELALRDILRESTGLKWERTPGSGALGANHSLKGDLYIPNATNYYCIEVKHYADDQFTSKILTNKSAVFLDWWAQTVRESFQVGKIPLLMFKYDRSKWFVAYGDPELVDPEVHFKFKNTIYSLTICLLDDWLRVNTIQWIK